MSPSFTLPALAMIKDNADIDNVDFEIVDLLQRNGRASYRSIAEALGVEEGQVKRRVNNLLKRNVIDIVAVLAFSPGSVVITVLTLNINGNFEQIGRQVAAWPEIQWLNICAGDADIVLSVYSNSLGELKTIIAKLNELSEVQAVKSYICLHVVKRGYIPPPPGNMREQDQKSEQPRKRPGKSVDADTLAANFESIKAWPIGEWLHRHIDALDWAIIQKLRVNGRTPFEVVAKSLGLNEGTVRKRVKRLVDGDIVQIVALPTPIVAERAFSGLVGIRVARDPALIAQEIAKWPEATWIGITGGDVSIWAEITAPSRALYLSSMQRISEISGVQSAQSLVYLRPIKLSLVGPIPAKSALALADWR